MHEVNYVDFGEQDQAWGSFPSDVQNDPEP